MLRWLRRTNYCCRSSAAGLTSTKTTHIGLYVNYKEAEAQLLQRGRARLHVDGHFAGSRFNLAGSMQTFKVTVCNANRNSYAITEFTEGHQYRRTDGLVGTDLMPYKAHSLKYQHFMLFPVPVYSKYEI